MKNALKCIRPSRRIQRLLKELLNGELSKPGREEDAKELEQHVKACAFCQQVCVEHAHEEVTIPFLKVEAKRLGVPFNTFMVEFRKLGEREIAAGKFHRKQRHHKE